MKYILNTAEPFKGHVLNTISNTLVDYTGETFEEYNAKHGGNLVVLTWEELESKYLKPWLKEMQGAWKETTEERFWYGLECVPPKLWRQFENGETFFVGECYTHNLYTCYVRKGEKYYTALRVINTPLENLINLVN